MLTCNLIFSAGVTQLTMVGDGYLYTSTWLGQKNSVWSPESIQSVLASRPWERGGHLHIPLFQSQRAGCGFPTAWLRRVLAPLNPMMLKGELHSDYRSPQRSSLSHCLIQESRLPLHTHRFPPSSISQQQLHEPFESGTLGHVKTFGLDVS